LRDEPLGDDPLGGVALDLGEPLGGEALGGEALDDEPFGGEALDDEAFGAEALDGEAFGAEAMGGDPLDPLDVGFVPTVWDPGVAPLESSCAWDKACAAEACAAVDCSMALATLPSGKRLLEAAETAAATISLELG